MLFLIRMMVVVGLMGILGVVNLVFLFKFKVKISVYILIEKIGDIV